MNILTPGLARNDIGGGGTFLHNLRKALHPLGHELREAGDYDMLLVAGASLCDRETVAEAQKNNKPIIFRVDNILEDSKNRNSGMPKIREYAELADVVVYQSQWAKRLLMPYTKKDGIVIYNGVDTDVFYPKGQAKDWEGTRIFYSKYSRNEVKRFHEVQYWYREYCIDKSDGTLVIVGRFADDLQKIKNPFEFHNNEEWEYKGIITDQNRLAEIMRHCDLAFLPYYADACSNTVLEVQACGLPVLYCPYGGTKEIITDGRPIDYNKSAVEMVDELLGRRIDETKKQERQRQFNLEIMGQKYDALIRTVLMPQYDV